MKAYKTLRNLLVHTKDKHTVRHVSVSTVHRLTTHALHTVFKATVQARLLYCAPAWSGFCSAVESTHLDSFLRCYKRLQGYCDVDTSPILEQFQLADEALCERVQNDNRHVLRSLMPPKTEYIQYNLRWHDYKLITKTSTLNTNHFLIRILYKDSY